MVSHVKRRREAENWLVRKIFGSKREEVEGDKNNATRRFMI